MSMVYTEDASIKIGGVILPGVYKSVEVSADAAVEEQDIQGSAVKPKQAVGFEDAKITIDLELWDSESQSKEDKLQAIQDIFRRADQGWPEAKDIISTHTKLRNVTRVVLKNLTSKTSNKKDNISVTLELWEYIPITIQASGTGGITSITGGGVLPTAASAGMAMAAKKSIPFAEVVANTRDTKLVTKFKPAKEHWDAIALKRPQQTGGGGMRR